MFKVRGILLKGEADTPIAKSLPVHSITVLTGRATRNARLAKTSNSRSRLLLNLLLSIPKVAPILLKGELRLFLVRKIFEVAR